MTWYAIAQRVIDGTIELTISPGLGDANESLFKRLGGDSVFRKRVHHVRIRDWHISHTEPIETLLVGWQINPFSDGNYLSRDYDISRSSRKTLHGHKSST